VARLLAHWITIAAFLGGAARIVPGAHVNSPAALAVVALVLGLVNAVVRAVLVVLTFFITLPTLGLFYLVNGFAFALAAPS
jgi:putative membrane protein